MQAISMDFLLRTCNTMSRNRRMSYLQIIPEFRQLHYSFVLSSDAVSTIKCIYTHRCQGCTIQRRIQHLSDSRRRSRNVNLNLGELFQPQCLRLPQNFFESGAADFRFCISTRLLCGAEGHSNANVDGLGLIGKGEQSTRLVSSAAYVDSAIIGGHTSRRHFQVVGKAE